ncbi:MAG TPA: nucleoside-diphosphate sugar epimerase/dehydratase [Candidatus Didemnitutus sp.]|nr:nucleoside-diphosphate sugar epimerase/dehydratase [Candidatus Didemnitutus sp.]
MLQIAKAAAVRAVLLGLAYVCLISASLYAAFEIRFDFAVPPEQAQLRLRLFLGVVALKLVALVGFRQFRSLITFFGVPDLLLVLGSVSSVTGILLIARFTAWAPISMPRGVLLIDFLLCTCLLCAFRLGARLFRERVLMEKVNGFKPATPIAIIGAGAVGASLAKELLSSRHRGFKPVAFFDDDPGKRGQLLHGVPVVGPPELIPSTVKSRTFREVVIAMPSAPARRIREIVQLVTGLHLKVETIPSVDELASGRVRVSRIRPIEIEDLLGRDVVTLAQGATREFLHDKVVVVTGAAGSIGSELCRQIATFNPAQLVMLDQSENGLFFLEQELAARGCSSFAQPCVADILDGKRMEAVFGRYRPHIVYHAAAYKHVFMMERHHFEAFQNNTLGTQRVAELAARHGAEAFVLISTDKAVNPTSVMGATKRLAEIQLQALHSRVAGPTKFMAVRFGNVLGSSGSVVPIFRQQIADGGPVTITHPDVCRYFMTIPEACGLVLEASVLGQGGEIFVLDMGKPVRIFDLAKQMIELSGLRLGEDIEIKYVGLRPGEKMNEELQNHSEDYAATPHPRILKFIARPGAIDGVAAALARLEALGAASAKNEFAREIHAMVPEYTPHLD